MNNHKGMNKGDLVNLMAELSNGKKSKTECIEAVNLFVNAVSTGLKKHGRVTLIGFGTFSVRQRNARNGYNPQTGGSIHIPASKQASFKAGSELKKQISS